jgi:hypothetical protein
MFSVRHKLYLIYYVVEHHPWKENLVFMIYYSRYYCKYDYYHKG